MTRDVQKQKAWYAAYYKANSEKMKARITERYKANPEKRKAWYRARYKANPEKEKARAEAYRKANPEKIKLRDAQKYNPGLPQELLAVIVMKNMIAKEIRNQTNQTT